LPEKPVLEPERCQTVKNNLDNWRNELHKEIGYFEERRIEVFEEIDDQALDMRPVIILIPY